MKDKQKIKNRIAELNAKIEEVLYPQFMVLNEEIVQAVKEIEDIQKECDHEFVDGECVICGRTVHEELL